MAWTSTDPKRTHFVWDGSRLLQEYTYKGHYTYIYTDQDSYEPLAHVFFNNKDDKQYLSYYHTDQIGMPREQTDQYGNLLWFGEYTAWGYLKSETKVYQNAHQPFRLQNQYFDQETGLHYNFLRYYEPDTGRFINQDPIGLSGGTNLYQFAPNAVSWGDPLGLYPTTVDSTCRQNPAFCAELFKSANSAMGTAAKAGAATVGAACAAGKCDRRKQDPCYCPPGQCGYVYLRVNPLTGESYVGQAKSRGRYLLRQQEHDRRLGARHDYTELGETKPGQCLDRLEEDHIRLRGGIQRRGGPLANKRHQMSDLRYRISGGKVPLPY